MPGPRLVVLAAALVASLGTAACGRSDSKAREEAPAPEHARETPAAAAEAAVDARVRWIKRLPAVPGVPVLQRVAGPIVVGDTVVAGSSVVGFVGLDRRTGELLWHRAGEEYPFEPSPFGADVALPGRCGHRAGSAPDDAIACVDVVDAATGAERRSIWVRAPAGVPRAAPIGRTADGFIWAGDGVVWRDGGASAREILERRDPESVAVAAAIEGRRVTIVWRDRISLLGAPGAAPLGWDEAAYRGVAGPVDGAGRLAVVVDDTLRWWTGSSRETLVSAPSPRARLSFAEGTLRGGETIGAIGLEGGVHVVILDPNHNRHESGPRVPGIQAHHAMWASEDWVVVASRRDVSLTRDDVTAFEDGRPLWTWPVPAPADGKRLDPVRVTADLGAVYVLIDGRQLAALERGETTGAP